LVVEGFIVEAFTHFSAVLDLVFENFEGIFLDFENLIRSKFALALLLFGSAVKVSRRFKHTDNSSKFQVDQLSILSEQSV
jgi:hypothetical protein